MNPPVRACIIFNPTARGEKAKRFRAQLQKIAHQCALKPTFEAGAGRTLASEAVREGFDTIVAAGGDGTVNEVLNGIGDEADGFERVRLGLLPIGTVNVFARELAIPMNLKKAWDVVQQGGDLRVDLPRMEWTENGASCRRYFAQMAGAGWDAHAIQQVSWNLKKRIGQFAYVFSGLKALGLPMPEIEARHGTSTAAGQLALIGNGRYYAGEVPLFRQANLQDGLLDVCLFPRLNWMVLLRYACSYAMKRAFRTGNEHHFQTPSLTLEAAHPVPFQVDGELAGHLPARCTLQTRLLRVRVPMIKPG